MIRLQRVGRVNVPTFRVVVTDSKNSTKSGRALEVIGMYDPVGNIKTIEADRVKHWMSHGAQLSDTVHNWLVHEKVISGKKVNKLPKKKPIVKEADKKAEGAAPAAPAPAAAPKAEAAPAAEAPKA